MGLGTSMQADHVRPGTDTIIERSERGTVTARLFITSKAPCLTDAGNVHLLAKDGRTMCYLKSAEVEIL